MSEELDSFEVSFPQSEESNSGGKKFETIAEGVYWVEVGEIRYKQHARGPMFGLKLKIKEDPMHSKYIDRLVWSNIIFLPYYSDAAKTKVTPGAGIARTFLKAIGQTYKGEKISVNPKAWVGASLGIRVKHDGTGRENVKNFYAVEDYRKALDTPATAPLPEEAIF